MENEAHHGPLNDALLTAQDLGGSFVTLGPGPGERRAVLGVADPPLKVTGLGPVVNTVDDDHSAVLSADGSTLVFSSDRPGGAGGIDLYLATRAHRSDPFGAAVNLGGVNTEHDEVGPELSADGLTLYFGSDRTGGSGGMDLYRATRPTTADSFGAVANLGPSVNTAENENNPSLSADGLVLLLNSNRRGGWGSQDIYMATRATTSDSFGPAITLGRQVEQQQQRFGPVPRSGRSVVVLSFEPSWWTGWHGSVRCVARWPIRTIWQRWAPWRHHQYASNDRSPSISSDGETLLFDSDRPGGRGGRDLYAAAVTAADWYQFDLGAGESTTLVLSPFATISEPVSLVFEQRQAGYLGTVDTELQEARPDVNLGQQIALNVDAAASGVSLQAAQVLMRFDGIFGNQLDQIRASDEIVSAWLELTVFNAGDSMRLHRMQQAWTDSDSWNDFGGNGIQADDVEAVSVPDALTAAPAVGQLAIDVTTSLRAWQQDPSSNHGWVLLPTGDDGVDFHSSDGTLPPRLVVEVASSAGQLELCDATGLVLAHAAVTADLSQAIQHFTVPQAGTYYARVTSQAAGPYQLVVTRNATLDIEPNDTLATAQPLHRALQALGHVGRAADPSAIGPTDTDFFSFQATAGDSLQLSIELPAAGPGARGKPARSDARAVRSQRRARAEYPGRIADASSGRNRPVHGGVSAGANQTSGPYVLSALVVTSGDVNHDGVVNSGDVEPFVDLLLSGQFSAAADMNEDQRVNGLDVSLLVAAILGGQGSIAALPADTADGRIVPAENATSRDRPADAMGRPNVQWADCSTDVIRRRKTTLGDRCTRKPLSGSLPCHHRWQLGLMDQRAGCGRGVRAARRTTAARQVPGRLPSIRRWPARPIGGPAVLSAWA